MDEMNFLDDSDDDEETLSEGDAWKILIVDDEPDVHSMTRLILQDFTFQDKPVEFLSAYSEKDVVEIFQEHDDISVILLDVVMEDVDSGFKVVKHIRENLNDHFSRIILRTGQPGFAPETEVVLKYDINGYEEKAELSNQRVVTAITTALRSYCDIMLIEEFRKNLEEMVADRTKELLEKNKLLEKLNNELEINSVTDPLTKVFNRRKFYSELNSEIARVRRHEHNLSLIMLDIDHFKNVNDTYGHAIGDEILLAISDITRQSIRENDVFARWGGEEFIILLPEAGIDEALMVAEKLRGKYQEKEHNKVGTVTASFGVASFAPDDDFEMFINRADASLYAAKKNGRNQVMKA